MIVDSSTHPVAEMIQSGCQHIRILLLSLLESAHTLMQFMHVTAP